jgi:hypothetical protein
MDVQMTSGPPRSVDEHAYQRNLGQISRALMIVLTAALCCAGVAHAGEWVQVSCVNPNQSAAPSQGWSSFAAGGQYGSNNSSACGPGSPMFAILSNQAAVGVSANETLQYRPPAGSTLNGGSIDVGFSADGHGYNASGTAVAYSPEYAYDASDVFFQCAAGLSPCANASNDFTGQLEIPAGRGGNLFLSAGCGGAAGASCNEGGSEGAWSSVRLWWANLRLTNSSTPAASGMSGTLLEPSARGTKELAFTATDYAGPGVYRVTVQADGQSLYSGTPDSNGGQCVAAGNSASALMFDASQPCRQSEAVDRPIDTTGVHDGQHTLKISVEDAAGNSSVVYDASITTQNAPANVRPPSVSTEGERVDAQHGEWTAPAGAGTVAYTYQWQRCDAQGANCQSVPEAQGTSYAATGADAGRTLRVLVTAGDADGSTSLASTASAVVATPLPAVLMHGASGGVDAFSAAGAPNGIGASERSQLRLGGRASILRLFAHRAFTISGALLTDSGTPIGGATLNVREQVQGRGAPSTLADVVTAPDGSFHLRVAAGASRLILIAYRAFAASPSFAAQASVHETVSAGVRMHITPRRTSPGGGITLAGVVAGPVPHQGVVVELLVRYRGRWEPLRTPRTGANGRFRVAYQFQGAVGRFPFRAEVFGGQSGYPYVTGHSESVDVSTG